MEPHWHSISIDESLSFLRADHHGLNEKEVRLRLDIFGHNKLKTKKGPSFFLLFAKQFFNPLVFILALAALVKFLSGGALDSSVLLGTILIMALIGFLQEAKAEKAMRALKEFSAHKSKVKREGKIDLIPSYLLVPGDLIILEPGDRIPADARLIEVSNLKVNESSFTGESMPVEKHTETLSEKLPLHDRRNMIYMGTTVSYGKGVALVVHTGMATEIGKIAEVLREEKSGKTPLQKNIHFLGLWMLAIVFAAVLLFIGIALYRGIHLGEVIMLGVAAAVSAIPEGLPAAFTITLAAGMHAMAKRHAIIRKLVSVETLGSTTVICSDKTGTLTMNQMVVKEIYTLGKKFTISEKIDPKSFPSLKPALEIGVLCNDALLTQENGTFSVVGDPTEGALLIAAEKAGILKEGLEKSYPRIDEIPFQSENLYMATLHPQKLFLKGAPEKILSFCTTVLKEERILFLGENEKREIVHAMEAMMRDSLRLIAVAYKDLPPREEHFTESNLTFVGIFGMIDPARPEAISAIEACKKAGIKVAMVTGDCKVTAAAIAKKLGLPDKNILSGEELEEMSEKDLREKIENIHIFARVEPLHKLRIVQAYQARGHVVAMTGDGVNDAPALETANIGVAMGISGTDVAKEASDMVLSDDNFASVVAAVEEGRAIFNRLRNVIAFLLATCFGELLGLILSVFVTGTPPLLPLQILWLNLVAGVIVAIPLSLEPKTGREILQPPRDPKVGLIFPGMIYRIAFLSLMLGISSFFIFLYAGAHASSEKARTIVLCSVVVFEWLIAINTRSDELSIFKLGILKNRSLLWGIASGALLLAGILYVPFLQEPFQTTPLSLSEWGLALIPGVLIFLIETLRKFFFPTLFNKGKWRK